MLNGLFAIAILINLYLMRRAPQPRPQARLQQQPVHPRRTAFVFVILIIFVLCALVFVLTLINFPVYWISGLFALIVAALTITSFALLTRKPGPYRRFFLHMNING